jgi:hypothetical protein
MPLVSTLANASARGYRIFAAGETNSYESIATLSGNGSSGTLSFTSIPSTYKHLQLRGIVREGSGGGSNDTFLGLQFNGDTASNYALHYIYGDGTSVSANGAGSLTRTYSGLGAQNSAPTYVVSPLIIDILDYQNANKNKTVRILSGFDKNGSGSFVFISGLWANTSAINRVDVFSKDSQSLSTLTTVALYGIKG